MSRKIAVVLLGLGVLLGVRIAVASDTEASVLRTERVEIIDPRGVVRVLLSVDKSGEASIVVRDENEQAVVVLACSAAGEPRIQLLNKTSDAVLAFTCGQDGSSGLSICDKQKRCRLRMGVDADGTPLLLLSGPQGEELFRAPK